MTTGHVFSAAFSRSPPIIEPAAADRIVEEILKPAGVCDLDPDATGPIAAALSAAPYLTRLARRDGHVLRQIVESGPGAVCDGAVEAAMAAGALSPDEAGRALRQAKRALHLATALADLTGVWDWREATKVMSRFADSAVGAAMETLAPRFLGPAAHENMPKGEGAMPGLFVLAMGKLGANELNYSSDVDLIVLYDRERVPALRGGDAASATHRYAQSIARLLTEPDVEGYVFRVDLRLRPDPSATPAAISTEAALSYYESLGRTWERVAYIRARACAGDTRAANEFLSELKPFVWRRSLDYYAIDEVRELKAGLRTKTVGGETGLDVKIGRGGIRDIEFFVQAHQLIFGGRRESLRARGIVEAVGALADIGVIDQAAGQALVRHYGHLRDTEHRIQMLEDEQTHALPGDPARRAKLAALSGYDDLASFDVWIAGVRDEVENLTAGLLTGNDGASNTLRAMDERLVELGFRELETITKRIESWRAGRARATRSARAQSSLNALLLDLVTACAADGTPDETFARFARFFEAVGEGVPLLAMLRAEPKLLADIVTIVTASTHLAGVLARRPSALQAMIDPEYDGAPDQHAGPTRLRREVASAPHYEAALDAARRVGTEELFQIGARVVLGRLDLDHAGPEYAALADAAITALTPVARAETSRQSSEIDGDMVVLGLGKLGGRELAATSDLDIMTVYAPLEGASARPSAQTRPLDPDAYFSRATKRLIAALSSPTAAGRLYDVDMQLRPSGSAGPIAVRFSALQKYYAGEAWTWELMALTRARVIAGDEGLAIALRDEIRDILTRRRERAKTLSDAAAMRAKMREARPDPAFWDMKNAAGGLVDVEFAVQALQLINAADEPSVLETGLLEGIAALHNTGVLASQPAGALAEAGRLHLRARQVLAAVGEGASSPETGSEPVRRRLADALEASSLEEAAARLKSVRETAGRFAATILSNL